MKLCKDCKYFNDITKRGDHANNCQHPKNSRTGSTNMITGDAYTFQQHSPKVMRQASWLDSILFGFCGSRGRWFTQKPIIIEVSPETFNQLKLVD
jgi:hypothetical protein